MTEPQANAIYDVLVREAGANESDRLSFVVYVTSSERWPLEFRFMGSLGFGGKFWLTRHDPMYYVNCYREDETPERLATIERTNAALVAVLGRVGEGETA